MTIEAIHTESLDEFWEYISPIGKFNQSLSSPIFRGQGNAQWVLSPSVLRTDVTSRFISENRKTTQVDHIISIEWELLFNFLTYLDQKGLSVPGDCAEFREAMNFDYFTQKFGIDGMGWPCAEFFPLIALAQHHGIPTRLMDWTRNPIVGAYFAASQALSLPAAPDRISVWIIESSCLNKMNGQLEFVALPGSTSHNLAAQDGVFLIFRQLHSMTRNDYFSAEEIQFRLNILIERSRDCNAYKITLPIKDIGHLIRRCGRFGISAATLFPGYDGAAKAAVEFKLSKKISDIS